VAGPNLPTNVDSTYPGSAADPSVDLHQQHHDTLHRFANKFDVDATPGSGQVLVWDAATNLYKPGNQAGGSTDLSGTPLIVSAASGGTGAYPARPATTRPVLFRGVTAPTTDGSTAGTGGMVIGLDQWLYWTSADQNPVAARHVVEPVHRNGVDDAGLAGFSNTKTQILGLINDASNTATNRVWSAAKSKAYADSVAGTGGGGATTALGKVDLNAAPYNFSTTATATANGAALQQATIDAAGRELVAKAGDYPTVGCGLTDQDINWNLPGCLPSAAAGKHSRCRH
jgi:hypothetical protein